MSERIVVIEDQIVIEANRKERRGESIIDMSISSLLA